MSVNQAHGMVFGLIVGSVILFIFAAVLYHKITKKMLHVAHLAIWLVIVFIAVIAGMIRIDDHSINIPAKSALISNEGKILLCNDEEIQINYWDWDRKLKTPQSQIICYKAEKHAIAMKINPITSNPKVRDISYKVLISRAENPLAYISLQKFECRIGRPIKHEVQYWLYEFNDKHSKEISRLYNPLDVRQQNEFNKMVNDFLAPHVHVDGVTIQAKFWL